MSSPHPSDPTHPLSAGDPNLQPTKVIKRIVRKVVKKPTDITDGKVVVPDHYNIPPQTPVTQTSLVATHTPPQPNLLSNALPQVPPTLPPLDSSLVSQCTHNFLDDPQLDRVQGEGVKKVVRRVVRKVVKNLSNGDNIPTDVITNTLVDSFPHQTTHSHHVETPQHSRPNSLPNPQKSQESVPLQPTKVKRVVKRVAIAPQASQSTLDTQQLVHLPQKASTPLIKAQTPLFLPATIRAITQFITVLTKNGIFCQLKNSPQLYRPALQAMINTINPTFARLWYIKYAQIVFSQHLCVSHIPLPELEHKSFSNGKWQNNNNLNEKSECDENYGNNWIIAAHTRFIERNSAANSKVSISPLPHNIVCQLAPNYSLITAATPNTPPIANDENSHSVPIFYIHHHPPMIPIQYYTYHWYYRLSALITFYTQLTSGGTPPSTTAKFANPLALTTDYNDYTIIRPENDPLALKLPPNYHESAEKYKKFHPFLQNYLSALHRGTLYPSCDATSIYAILLNECSVLQQYGQECDQQLSTIIKKYLQLLPMHEMSIPSSCGGCMDVYTLTTKPNTVRSIPNSVKMTESNDTLAQFCACTPEMKQLFKIQLFSIVSCIKRSIYEHYMSLLHTYNEIKESSSIMMGHISQYERVSLQEVYDTYVPDDLKEREKAECGN